MPDFDWRALDAQGRAQNGRQEAATAELLQRQLRARGLVPLLVEPAGRGAPIPVAPLRARVPSWSRSAAVGRADVLSLTQELAVMLKAGLPMVQALHLLADMSTKPAVRALVDQIQADVKGGSALSRAVARHEAQFSPFYVQMVRAGEAAGQLPSALERLAEHLSRAAALRESVVSAATYPMILLCIAVLSTVGIVGFVVPQFEKLFADMGDAVPLSTRVVLAISQHVRDWGAAWLAALLALAVGLAAWRRTPAGAMRSQAILLQLPLLGTLLRQSQLGLFERTLGTLTSAGVPLLMALDIAVDTVSNQPLQRALRGMVMPVKSGSRMAQAMLETGQFEALAVNLVRVGEETGRLGPLLLEAARIADQRVETGIKRMLAVLEPALIVVLGVLVAGIIVSILLGILSVNEIAA